LLQRIDSQEMTMAFTIKIQWEAFRVGIVAVFVVKF